MAMSPRVFPAVHARDLRCVACGHQAVQHAHTGSAESVVCRGCGGGHCQRACFTISNCPPLDTRPASASVAIWFGVATGVNLVCALAYISTGHWLLAVVAVGWPLILLGVPK